MLASYHNHSSFSDGKGPIAELLSHARSLGVGELGVSDHLTLHPSGQPVSWSMCPDRLGEYLREARGLASRSRSSGGPLLRVGLEVDWFDGQEGVIREKWVVWIWTSSSERCTLWARSPSTAADQSGSV